MRKAHGNYEDMRAILHWLARNNLHIDFTAYPEKPKKLLPGFRKLYELNPIIVRSPLKVTVDAHDFALSCN